MSGLSAGAGLCPVSAQLSLRATKAVVELGALADVVQVTLNAVHHANRHGCDDDRIAVAFPGLHLHRRTARSGQEIVLFGSEQALQRYIAIEGVQSLVRRGMVAELDIAAASLEAGTPGTAYLRDRAAERRSPGAVRRALARAARRGKPMFQDIEVRETDLRLLALRYGDVVIHIREQAAQMTGAPLLVGTYGFSSSTAPAVLPILPDSTPRWADDAA